MIGDERGATAEARGAARLVVGLVRGFHGLKGAVRVEVLTDDPTRFQVGSVLHPEGGNEPLTVIFVQEDGPGLLIRFAERPTRESVEPLRDTYVEADVRDPLPQGAYYWHEVMGARVATAEGEHLGAVEDVFRAGGGEVFVVRGGPRGEVMVPAVGSVVREFRPREGRIVVDADALALDEPAEEGPPRRRARRRRGAGAGVAASAGDPAQPSG